MPNVLKQVAKDSSKSYFWYCSVNKSVNLWLSHKVSTPVYLFLFVAIYLVEKRLGEIICLHCKLGKLVSLDLLPWEKAIICNNVITKNSVNVIGFFNNKTLRGTKYLDNPYLLRYLDKLELLTFTKLFSLKTYRLMSVFINNFDLFFEY